MSFTLLFLFTIKHCVADVFLQTFHQGVDKSKYLDIKGHRHYLEHGVCTFLIAVFFVNPVYAVLAGLLDYLIHWHVDWGKTSFCIRFGIQRNTNLFWRIHTLDQIAHFSTYALIVWIFTYLSL